MFSDGSSFVFQGQRYAGAAVTTDREVLWQQTLPPGTSAQRAELISLTKALKLGRNKSVNIYTDSRYAFATAHVHGSIYQERGLLTAEGKAIKNKAEILDLLAAIWEPARLAIIHCPGHQKGNSLEAVGNRLADAAAREAALTKSESALELPILTEPLLPLEPSYTPNWIFWSGFPEKGEVGCRDKSGFRILKTSTYPAEARRRCNGTVGTGPFAGFAHGPATCTEGNNQGLERSLHSSSCSSPPLSTRRLSLGQKARA
ncbi:uncharacterized protein LOC122239417 isoform X1 [Panthera tigris]|uniref:uncharacterized protein LOC122239417 isoform X1 n=1 Tax=Panthera tigris TaxID=9694 RepID=UPI001C6F93A2|nr:uncharacterized protein LOC122239417 isoform X1 [Panthera tigris]